MALKDSFEQTKVRVLLMLWWLDGAESEVKGSVLHDNAKKSGEGKGDHLKVYESLEKDGAISLSGDKKRISENLLLLLTPKGLTLLQESLKTLEFTGRQVNATRLASALVRWIGAMDGKATVATNGAVSAATDMKAIASYEEFTQVALDTYDRLNQDYNLDDLVPIYRIRREIGDRVARSDFNEWMLDMQANDIFLFMEGSLPDGDPAKLEDSLTTELSGLRCYAKRIG